MGNFCSKDNQIHAECGGGDRLYDEVPPAGRIGSIPRDVMVYVMRFLHIIECCSTTIPASKWFRRVSQMAFAQVDVVDWKAKNSNKTYLFLHNNLDRLGSVPSLRSSSHLVTDSGEFSAGMTRVICRFCKNLSIMKFFCGTALELSQIFNECPKLRNPGSYSPDNMSIEALTLVSRTLQSITHFSANIHHLDDLRTVQRKLVLPQLTKLALSSYTINTLLMPTALNRTFQRTYSLTSLALFGFCRFNLITFVNMPHLTELYMPYCNLNNESCIDLARSSKQLHDLSLHGNNVTIRGIHELSHSLSQLKKLNLKLTSIEMNEIIMLLRDDELFPHLLHLILCSHVCLEDRHELMEIRENLKFTFD